MKIRLGTKNRISEALEKLPHYYSSLSKNFAGRHKIFSNT